MNENRQIATAMNFPTPDDNVSTETETETETKIFDGRDDEMENYAAVIETERMLQKLCLTNGVAVDGDFARYTDAEGQSPLADHGLFYYRQKKAMKADFREKRESGELPDDHTLPNYREQFPEPEYDYVVVDQETAVDFGIDPELFEDDETIHLPTAYEPETDDDGNLIVWYETDGNASKDDVLEVLNGVKGIGPKTAGRALNALQDAGVVEL